MAAIDGAAHPEHTQLSEPHHTTKIVTTTDLSALNEPSMVTAPERRGRVGIGVVMLAVIGAAMVLVLLAPGLCAFHWGRDRLTCLACRRRYRMAAIAGESIGLLALLSVASTVLGAVALAYVQRKYR